MKAPARRTFLIVAATTMVLLAACSGSSNAKKNKAETSSLAGTATSASAANAVTAIPAATLTPRAASVTTPTVQPAAAASPRANSSPRPTAIDQALQAQLQAAALRESDLPSGFQQSSSSDEPGDLSGVVASYDATFTRVAQGSGGLSIDAVVVALAGFKDAPTAQSSFGDIKNQLSAIPNSSITLTPVTLAQRFGDETLAFKVSGEASGVQVNGYAIVWRRNRLAAALVQVGAPGPQTIDQLTSLAQTQDNRLKTLP